MHPLIRAALVGALAAMVVMLLVQAAGMTLSPVVVSGIMGALSGLAAVLAVRFGSFGRR